MSFVSLCAFLKSRGEQLALIQIARCVLHCRLLKGKECVCVCVCVCACVCVRARVCVCVCVAVAPWIANLCERLSPPVRAAAAAVCFVKLCVSSFSLNCNHGHFRDKESWCHI